MSSCCLYCLYCSLQHTPPPPPMHFHVLTLPFSPLLMCFRLFLKSHSGTAGRQSSLVIHGADFSTKDMDNDNCMCKCALMLTGGKCIQTQHYSDANHSYHGKQVCRMCSSELEPLFNVFSLFGLIKLCQVTFSVGFNTVWSHVIQGFKHIGHHCDHLGTFSSPFLAAHEI